MRMKLANEYGLTLPEINMLVFGIKEGKNPQIGQSSWEEHMENICKELKVDKEEGEDFIDMFFAGDHLNSVLIDLIKQHQQNYKIGILSNAMSNLRELMTDSWKIIDLFDEIVNSSEEGFMKPDPRIYNLALDKLGVLPNEAIFIDDMPENITAANELGINGIRFESNPQTINEINELLKEN
jgi:putative hydrolase of the HAD superfamily